jgi:osmotically-inducible protein OsmY
MAGKEELMRNRPGGNGYGADPLDYPLPETVAEAERLAASIERAVQRSTGGGVRNLRVEIDRGGVRLEGRCNTYYCKQLAQQAAMGLSGDRLTNEIEVS